MSSSTSNDGAIAREGDEADRWECGECGLAEGQRIEGAEKAVKVDAVCHHCGMPLCLEDQHFIVDDAFSRENPFDQPDACHCSTCRRLHGHSRAI